MTALHILQGGIDNGDRDWLVEAARRNLSTTRWITPKSAKAGDDAVIYVGRAFFATASIRNDAAKRPDWGPRAYGAGLSSVKLIQPPVEIETIRSRIPTLAWARYPRSVTTPAPELAAQIRDLVGIAGEIAADLEELARDRKVKNQTTRRTLIEARLGQGKFRADLVARWGGACAVTGCKVVEVLRASHIKPWRMSDDRERLDPANGLLLCADLDALFDAGLISFDDQGRMVVSSTLPAAERKRLRVPRSLSRPPDRRIRAYLEQHRRHRLRK